MFNKIKSLIVGLEYLVPAGDLLIRIYIAWVFLKAGLTKKATGFTLLPSDTTFLLFQYEYSVPLIPSDLAAYMGTAAELILPVLLILGVAGRWSALGLFVFNIVAVISYPTLNAAGIEQHKVWGLILLYFALRGPGKLSLDHLFRRNSMPDNMPNP